MSAFQKKKFTARNMALCALFAALTAVGAFIRIPIPVCPFTLQVLFVILAGLVLGKKDGAISIIVYAVIGLIGFPVFTEGGGISYIFKPTFGYIIGFIVGAYISGAIAHHTSAPTFKRLITASFTGLAIIYLIGMTYFYLISNFVINTPIGIKALLIYCFLTTISGDIISCVIAVVISKRIIPVTKNFR